MSSWKRILPLFISGSLIACTSTPETPEPPVEPAEPVAQQPIKVVEEVKPDSEVVSEQPEPEVKPEQDVQSKPKASKPVKAQKTADGKLILGAEEWVYIPGIDQTFKSRVDTGATTSSISATEVVPFERDGKDWVQFKVDLNGKVSREFKLPVVRWAKVRQSSTEETQKRAVVETYIQVGDLKEKTEFTLAERGHMTFPILLGRSFFRDVAVVDVSRKYVQNRPAKVKK
ncbi:ATP-dependent zinc protease [Vibrio sp. CAU 1672]|uniref:ATP-dependent zinc protease family protein n=1 Tax=Vibrio sp. CAU 1672 TaxID=3032594 RepID=UPI0023DB9FDB|nr:ATP-dependent zinc protease [Vibrio sp. CAU 1672]MDF2154496.1 ATP-dependent zinc protease [Vibrio sp. CAU 1672]